MDRGSDRKLVISGIFIGVGLIFAIRLFFIQVVNDELKLSATNNVLRYETEYAARGVIFDRHGELLAFNQPVYDLMVIPRQAKNADSSLLCSLLGWRMDEFSSRFRKASQYSKMKPSIFEKQLSAEDFARLRENLYLLPGFFVQERTLRKYPRPIAAHLLGYIGEADEKVIVKRPYYRLGDYLGISGLEMAYEEELRGKRGMKIMLVDVHNRPQGRFQNGMYDTAAVAGFDLVSTLDGELQEYAENLMQNKKGGIVALDPTTGEILALVSAPGYDPNLLVGRVRSKNYKVLLSDTNKTLFNRALMAYYPPGSTFKIINGLIAKQEKMLSDNTLYGCIRGWPPGGGKPGCEVTAKHFHPVPLDFHGSIQYSCNSYYSYVFRSILDNKKYPSTEKAFDAWRKFVLSFGIGEKIHSDLPYERPGNVPSVAYYDKYFGKGRWRPATIISLGIGQGELGITPLQMANVMAIVANRGYFFTPHIIKEIRDSAANAQLKDRFSEKHYTLVNAEYYESTVEGMNLVTERGTAAGSKIPGIPYCGKTGTAQNPHGKDHSVFMAFAPKDNPKIAIAALVENGGWGSAWAAPIVSLMIEKYLTDSISRPDLEKRMLEGDLIHKFKKDTVLP